MSKKSTTVAAENVETKVAETEVKVEKKPTEKQTMLADYKVMSAAHKAWRQKFNANFPRLHAEAEAYLKAVAKQIEAWDKELDKLLAKPAAKAESKAKETVAA